ncbi:MAG: anion permease, partial [Dissulfurispiraceae bacterium]
ISPLVGFILGGFIMFCLARFFCNQSTSLVNNIFSRFQIVSAAYMAFSHGNNDAQKTMGIITMALVSYYHLTAFDIPSWVILTCAVAMASGTAVGGWRIIKTLGTKLAQLRPINGFAAETAAATVIELASRIGMPLSTTHVISSSIMGVIASKRISAVRWTVGGNIIAAWVITIPACATLAWVICKVLALVVS